MNEPKTNQRLARARKSAGLTMTQLAKKSGVSLSTVFRMEMGLHAPMNETARKLARALNLPIEKLF